MTKLLCSFIQQNTHTYTHKPRYHQPGVHPLTPTPGHIGHTATQVKTITQEFQKQTEWSGSQALITYKNTSSEVCDIEMGQLHSELSLSNVPRWRDGSKHTAYAKRWLSISRPVNTVADLTAFIKDPHLRLSVALTAQHRTEPWDLQTHFFTLYIHFCTIQWREQLSFLPHFQAEILEAPQIPFCLGPTQQCEREAGSPTGKFV